MKAFLDRRIKSDWPYFCIDAPYVKVRAALLPDHATDGATSPDASKALAELSGERCAMILTSNRGFAEWGDVFGDPVVATALLDRLLHHAIVIQIDGASYRLRQHTGLIPENSLVRPPTSPHAAPPKRRRRPPKNRMSDHHAG